MKKFFLYVWMWMWMTPLFANSGIVKSNGIEIWYETFGEKKDPAVLLIMGGFCQGILWPQEFCQKLASNGFYVIRFDHRDTGFSTCFDFEKDPYDLFDMAKDGIGLIDALHIDRAHVCGLSMGGPIGEVMSIHFPGRVTGLTLIATSEEAPRQVTVPTAILHGLQDQIFPPDHGEALHHAIKGSKYLLVDGFGHVPNQYFYDLFIQAIKGDL